MSFIKDELNMIEFVGISLESYENIIDKINKLETVLKEREKRISIWIDRYENLRLTNNRLKERNDELEVFLQRIAYADRYTWEKDGTDIFEAFSAMAEKLLEK